MNEQPRESRVEYDPRLERAIVLQLLRDDHPPSWPLQELTAELGGGEAAVGQAAARLQQDGLLALADGQLSASRAARRLDELGLIGV
jgi:biotin operon repressor